MKKKERNWKLILLKIPNILFENKSIQITMLTQ